MRFVFMEAGCALEPARFDRRPWQQRVSRQVRHGDESDRRKRQREGYSHWPRRDSEARRRSPRAGRQRPVNGAVARHDHGFLTVPVPREMILPSRDLPGWRAAAIRAFSFGDPGPLFETEYNALTLALSRKRE